MGMHGKMFPAVSEQDPALPSLHSCPPSFWTGAPAGALGSFGGRNEEGLKGQCCHGFLGGLLAQAPIVGLLQREHLLPRSPATHVQGPRPAAFPDVGDALSSHLISCSGSAPVHTPAPQDALR